jgi:hypothetical protein
MRFIGYDAQGTEAPVLAIYELDGQIVSIPAATAPDDIKAAVLAALSLLDNPKPARAQLNDFLTNNQDMLIYASYFFRLQKALLTQIKTTPNLTDTTTAVYAAVRQNKDSDADDLTIYNRFLWFVQRTKGLVLVSGDLPAMPTALQAQQINDAAYEFMLTGVMASLMLLRG